jgi:hypothetical protein
VGFFLIVTIFQFSYIFAAWKVPGSTTSVAMFENTKKRKDRLKIKIKQLDCGSDGIRIPTTRWTVDIEKITYRGVAPLSRALSHLGYVYRSERTFSI